MTDLVTDPPISSAPPVQTQRQKPSAKSKGKQAQVAEDDETLIQRQVRLAKQKEQEDKDLINSKLLNFHSQPEHKKAQVAKQLGILHLVSEKYRRQIAEGTIPSAPKEKVVASSATEKVVTPKVTKEKDAAAGAAKKNVEAPSASKDKAAAPSAVTKPIAAAKATKDAEKKAKEARQKAQAAPVPRVAPAPAPAAPVVFGPRADEESSKEGDSAANASWDATHISHVLWKMATTPSKVIPRMMSHQRYKSELLDT